MGRYTMYCDEPREVWQDPLIAHRWCLMLAAGKCGQHRFPVGPRMQLARHEASHLIAGWFLGFKIGGAVIASGERGGLARVHTQSYKPLEPLPAPAEAHRSRSRTKQSDWWRISRIALLYGWGHDWKSLLRFVRQLQAQAGELVRTHWDVIDSVATELNDRGELDAAGVRHAIYSGMASAAQWNFSGALTA